jgi:type IV pilus assembly protein PilE
MHRSDGFTLPEVLIVMTILGVLAGIALPTYQGYIQRSTLTEAFDTLSAYRLRMDRAFNDNGNYGTDACAVAAPGATTNFSFTCTLSDAGQGYLTTATGAGRMNGYVFTVNDDGVRTTESFPDSTVPAACWLTKAGAC